MDARAGQGPDRTGPRMRRARYALGRPPRPFFSPLRAAAHALQRAPSRARISGSSLRLRALSRAMRLRPAALHSFEQYRTPWFGAATALPHSLHFTAVSLPIFLSALALHRLQWSGRLPRPPGGAKLWPHSAHGYGSTDFALRLGLAASRPARGGGCLPPRSPALRAALRALWRASCRACFSGSALRLRSLSMQARRAAAARHASEQ